MFKLLEKLQNSDEGTKRRWMIILTAVAMAITIYVWLAYFNNLVAGFSSPAQNIAANEGGGVPAASASGGFTFWQSAKSGLGLISSGFLDKLRWFGEILGEPREYIIAPR